MPSASPRPLARSLAHTLRALDAAGYGAARSLVGSYDLGDAGLDHLDGAGSGSGEGGWTLRFASAPADPYAPPGRLMVRGANDFPEGLWATGLRRVCLAHFLSAQLAARFHSRDLRMDRPGCAVLERTSVWVGAPGAEAEEDLAAEAAPTGSAGGGASGGGGDGADLDGSGKRSVTFSYTTGPGGGRGGAVPASFIEYRFDYHLPAKGRRILGHSAARLFGEELPSGLAAVRWSGLSEGERAELEMLIHAVEDQAALQEQLAAGGYVAFVGDGAVLPREGNSQWPLPGAVPFEAPARLRVSFHLPHRGQVTGLGLKAGEFTVITGANYHGKSTLLEALGVAHYRFVPGDGRELVKAPKELIWANKEKRRVVRGVDISPFFRNLAGGAPTSPFSTPAASGSTSQAAAICESVEMGAAGVLIDEDDSAVNLLVKDQRLRRLVPEEMEPLRPLLESIRNLPREHGVTPILVAGALGEFAEVADTILLMQEYRVVDATEALRQFRSDPMVELPPEMAALLPPEAVEELGRAKAALRERQRAGAGFGTVAPRRPSREWVPQGRTKIFGQDELVFKPDRRRGQRGPQATVDLRGDFQRVVMEPSQLRALAEALGLAHQLCDGERTLAEVVEQVFARLEAKGVETLRGGWRDLAAITPGMVHYALNRVAWEK